MAALRSMALGTRQRVPIGVLEPPAVDVHDGRLILAERITVDDDAMTEGDDARLFAHERRLHDAPIHPLDGRGDLEDERTGSGGPSSYADQGREWAVVDGNRHGERHIHKR